MAARIHCKMRNHLRKNRYAKPLDIDVDVSTSLLIWKYKNADFPAFYKKTRGAQGGKDEEENIISEAGEEWLLQNQALADQFLKDSLSTTLSSSIKPGDRYSRLFDDDLKRNACYPTWPQGAEGVLPLILWIWSFWYRDAMGWAGRLFWFLAISHAIEVVLVLLWLHPVGFTYTAKLAWVIYAYICGWPITGRTKVLSGIVLSKEEKKEAARLKKALSKKKT